MTIKEIFNDESNENFVVKLALFTAMASTAFLLESIFPRPLPFLKLGLANVIILFLITQKKILLATITAFLKIIIGGIFSGTIISPTIIFSLSGTLFSLIGMIIFSQKIWGFSILGISVIGAVLHNLGQAIGVKLFIIKEIQLLKLIPLLIIVGIISGSIIGFLTFHFRKLILSKEAQYL